MPSPQQIEFKDLARHKKAVFASSYFNLRRFLVWIGWVEILLLACVLGFFQVYCVWPIMFETFIDTYEFAPNMAEPEEGGGGGAPIEYDDGPAFAPD